MCLSFTLCLHCLAMLRETGSSPAEQKDLTPWPQAVRGFIYPTLLLEEVMLPCLLAWAAHSHLQNHHSSCCGLG